MSVAKESPLAVVVRKESPHYNKIRRLEEKIRWLEISNNELNKKNVELTEQNAKMTKAIENEQKLYNRRTELIKKLTILSGFLDTTINIMTTFHCFSNYRIFGSVLRNIITSDYRLPEPGDIDIMFYIQKVNPNLNMEQYVICLFKNIWGEKISIEEKTCSSGSYQLPYHFLIKYNGIEIDLSVTEEYSSLKKAICKLEDTTATSYSCDEEGINFLRCKSPAEAVITILKAQMGKVYATKPKLSAPFLRVDINRLKRIEKVTSVYRYIPDYPLLTGDKMITCPVLRIDINFCPILKCGHYISFEALIKIIEGDSYDANCPICRAKIDIAVNIEDCTLRETLNKNNPNLSDERIEEICDTDAS